MPMSSTMTQVGLEVAGRNALVAGERLVADEVVDEVEDRSIEDGVPGADRLLADGLRDVALADAGRADQEDVLRFADEPAGRDVEDLRPLDLRVEAPVEVLESLLVAEARGLHATVEEPLLPDGEFVLERELEELEMVEAVAGGLLQADVEGRREAREPELSKGSGERFVHRVVVSLVALDRKAS